LSLKCVTFPGRVTHFSLRLLFCRTAPPLRSSTPFPAKIPPPCISWLTVKRGTHPHPVSLRGPHPHPVSVGHTLKAWDTLSPRVPSLVPRQVEVGGSVEITCDSGLALDSLASNGAPNADCRRRQPVCLQCLVQSGRLSVVSGTKRLSFYCFWYKMNVSAGGGGGVSGNHVRLGVCTRLIRFQRPTQGLLLLLQRPGVHPPALKPLFPTHSPPLCALPPQSSSSYKGVGYTSLLSNPHSAAIRLHCAALPARAWGTTRGPALNSEI